MKYLLLAFAVVIAIAVAVPRFKRQAYYLPDGAELVVGTIKTSFSCEGRGHGYYADVDNGCKVFHVCNPVVDANGYAEMQHYSFYCGNLTLFNQFSLTCDHEEGEGRLPCQSSAEFYNLNERIGQENALLHTDDDVERLKRLLVKK